MVTYEQGFEEGFDVGYEFGFAEASRHFSASSNQLKERDSMSRTEAGDDTAGRL
jgi:hypothetical protein